MHSGAPPGGQRVLGDSDQRQSPADADQAYAKANYRATKPKEASVRAVALSSTGVDPRESECDDLVEELLLRGGYTDTSKTYPLARPLAPTGSVPTHRPRYGLNRGELDSSAPKAHEPSECPARTLLRPCPHQRNSEAELSVYLYRVWILEHGHEEDEYGVCAHEVSTTSVISSVTTDGEANPFLPRDRSRLSSRTPR